jgi:hypothetical protein
MVNYSSVTEYPNIHTHTVKTCKHHYRYIIYIYNHIYNYIHSIIYYSYYSHYIYISTISIIFLDVPRAFRPRPLCGAPRPLQVLHWILDALVNGWLTNLEWLRPMRWFTTDWKTVDDFHLNGQSWSLKTHWNSRKLRFWPRFGLAMCCWSHKKPRLWRGAVQTLRGAEAGRVIENQHSFYSYCDCGVKTRLITRLNNYYS